MLLRSVEALGKILSLIDESGLRYRLTPSSTCIEGEWDDGMPLVKRCHELARSHSSHVLTSIRIEDEEGTANKLNENMASVERVAGRRLKRC